MARPPKAPKQDAFVADAVTPELQAEWNNAESSSAFVVGLPLGSSVIDTKDSTLSAVKKLEIFARYLDIKKATSIGNVHGVTVVVYELLSIHKGDGYLFDGNDVKIVLEHFGYKADFIVDNAVEARNEISSLSI